MLTHTHRIAVLVLISASAAIGMLFVDPIPQDPAYHLFADTRTFAGIANGWNVLSNLPFVFVGLYGLWRYRSLSEAKSEHGYLALCLGALLIGAGSSWYHLAPDTGTLLWDRLPMTIAFMATLSLLLDERVVPASNRSTLWPLLIAGAAAALYWAWTESIGHGDLRPYAVIQFLPLALIPLILVFFKSGYLSNAWLGSALALYVVAKSFEFLDRQVYEIATLGGHSLKHVLAAASLLCIILAVPAGRGSGRRN